MLAELAAANAAFAVIKKCVENGSELAKAGKAISDFTLNKDAVQKKAAAKGSNLDGSKSDLEEFLALDELKRREVELFKAESTDDNLARLKAISTQIKRHEQEAK